MAKLIKSKICAADPWTPSRRSIANIDAEIEHTMNLLTGCRSDSPEWVTAVRCLHALEIELNIAKNPPENQHKEVNTLRFAIK